jgi:signal transduction histidine kinase
VATLRTQLTVAARAHGVPVELRIGGLPDLAADVEHQVLRIAQEAVANALRHAGAGRVEVALGRVEGATPPAVRLRVVDDGRGFDPEARAVRSRRLGLTSMHERAASLGGSLGIESAPGRGTTVELRFPA